MGCCVSSTTKSTVPNSHTSKSNGEIKLSKSPPPSHSLEEETVKEVLSETPTIPKQKSSTTILKIQQNKQNRVPFTEPPPLLSDFAQIPDAKQQKDGIPKKPFMIFNNDEISEDFAEICSSISESVSISTSVTEKRENGGNVNMIKQNAPTRFKNRSFSGEVNREKSVAKSPGRVRSEPSPGRVRTGPMTGRIVRRESGEISCRRSMSPGTRMNGGSVKTGLTRNQVARRTGKSPGRIGYGLDERTRMMEESNETMECSSNEIKWPPAMSSESLENPLVSLECFIFL